MKLTSVSTIVFAILTTLWVPASCANKDTVINFDEFIEKLKADERACPVSIFTFHETDNVYEKLNRTPQEFKEECVEEYNCPIRTPWWARVTLHTVMQRRFNFYCKDLDTVGQYILWKMIVPVDPIGFFVYLRYRNAYLCRDISAQIGEFLKNLPPSTLLRLMAPESRCETGSSSSGNTESQTGSSSSGKTKSQTGSSSSGNTKSQTGSSSSGNTKSQTGSSSSGNTKSQTGSSSSGNTKSQTGSSSSGNTKSQTGSSSRRNTESQTGSSSRANTELQSRPPSSSSDTELTCSICLSPITPETPDKWIARDCGHAFHLPCIQKWIDHSEGRKTCPYCRAFIPRA